MSLETINALELDDDHQGKILHMQNVARDF